MEVDSISLSLSADEARPVSREGTRVKSCSRQNGKHDPSANNFLPPASAIYAPAPNRTNKRIATTED